MTWAEVKRTLTTPPPPRPPPPKAPLFTTDPFSTKSFGPGHIVGAGVLALGLYGLTKFFVARGRAQAEETRRLAEQRPPRRPEDLQRPPQAPPQGPGPEPQLAQAQNGRGEYGRKR